jgi:hypothetical protein
LGATLRALLADRTAACAAGHVAKSRAAGAAVV